MLRVVGSIEVSHTTIYHNDNRRSRDFGLSRIELILRDLRFKNRTLNGEGMRHSWRLPAKLLTG